MKNFMALPLAFALCASAFAGESEDKGRALLEQHQKAIVTVQLVIKQKMSFGGSSSEEDEARREITGTVISPEGLTVVSLARTDPSVAMSDYFAEEMGDKFKVEFSISSVKLLLDDGRELESVVVLRDKDLDLVFVRPKVRPDAALPFIDLAHGGTAQVLDEFVALSRMGKVGNRAPGASLGHIHAVATKPRTLYFPDAAGMGDNADTGSPALTLDGKVLGVIVTRTLSGDAGNTAYVIMPAADISEAASQAPPFGQEPKEEAPAAEEPKAEDSTTKVADPAP